MSKVCKNCKWFHWYSNMCRRFPEWVVVTDEDFHYCGEFKERDGE